MDEPTQPEAVEEDKGVKSHILTPAEIEEWKNGAPDVQVLRRASDAVEAPATEEEKAEPTTEPEEPAEVPALAVQALDPGEFVPTDRSFEVTIYDSEGNHPKTHTIGSIEDFEALLESDSNFGSASALLKAQRLATKMEAAQEREYAEWEKSKETFDTETEAVNARMSQLTNISNEMDYLVAKGQLPAVSKELKDANWSDPEIAAQAGVKEQIALLSYMEKENRVRTKAGLAPMTSVLDAWNAMQLEEAKTGQANQAKRAADARKAAGARVGGSQPAQASNVPKGYAVGRVVPGGLRGL